MGFIALVYGVVCYVLFFASFLYLVVFVGGDALPFVDGLKSVDSGSSPLAGAPAALVNIGLLLLFGLQHSVMARQGFKRVLTKLVSPNVERSTYVLVTALILFALYAYWIPMPGMVWEITGMWSTIMLVLFFVGVGMVLLSTFLINHFELFGLAQVWARFTGKPQAESEFRTPLLYKVVRHPLYLGMIIFFWATPLMTTGHLLFAAIWTAYIFVGVGYEERDLLHAFGDKYRDYARRVPSIFPFGGSKD